METTEKDREQDLNILFPVLLFCVADDHVQQNGLLFARAAQGFELTDHRMGMDFCYTARQFGFGSFGFRMVQDEGDGSGGSQRIHLLR